MKCRQAGEWMDAALDAGARNAGGRELPDRWRQALDAHLSACPACRGQWEMLRAADAALRSPRPVPVPAGMLQEFRQRLEATGTAREHPAERARPRPLPWIHVLGSAGAAMAAAAAVIVLNLLPLPPVPMEMGRPVEAPAPSPPAAAPAPGNSFRSPAGPAPSPASPRGAAAPSRAAKATPPAAGAGAPDAGRARRPAAPSYITVPEDGPVPAAPGEVRLGARPEAAVPEDVQADSRARRLAAAAVVGAGAGASALPLPPELNVSPALLTALQRSVEIKSRELPVRQFALQLAESADVIVQVDADVPPLSVSLESREAPCWVVLQSVAVQGRLQIHPVENQLVLRIADSRPPPARPRGTRIEAARVIPKAGTADAPAPSLDVTRLPDRRVWPAEWGNLPERRFALPSPEELPSDLRYYLLLEDGAVRSTDPPAGGGGGK